MNKITHKYRNSVKALLSESELGSLLNEANSLPRTELGDLEFSAYQQSVFQRIFPGLTYEFCTTSRVDLSDDETILGLNTTNYNLPDEIVASYLINSKYDELSPISYDYPGRALNYTHVCRVERIKDHPFFQNHCVKFGIHHAMTIAFLHPWHSNTLLTFDYMGDEKNDNWMRLSHVKIELASFPFALAWLFRDGKIDYGIMKKYFLLLSGLTENRFLNLRGYINNTDVNFEKLGQKLGVKPSWLKEDLAKIRDEALEKLGITIVESKTRPYRILDTHYSFLRMLGDHTIEVPKKSTQKLWVLS